MMRRFRRAIFLFALLTSAASIGAQVAPGDSVPLPEHPRPDFQRDDWLNLNGRWQFRLDAADEGLKARWFAGELQQTRSILVPFSWGAPLSGVPDSADIGWYARSIEVPRSWRGKRIFLVVGASDWRTSVWLDGKKLGDHEGGYTPFSFELTPDVTYGTTQRLTIRVDDASRPFLLEGKQGYGNARGIWQTVYLEARGTTPLEWVHFTPDLARQAVNVEARLRDPAPNGLTLRLGFRNTRSGGVGMSRPVPKGSRVARFTVPLPNAHLWTLDDPYLYQVAVTLRSPTGPADIVNTYFGMRSISVVQRPGSTDSYVALNGKPVYLQLALDQAYHPTGYYTFPTDAMLRDEILRARMIGLNGLREHVKIEAPRKLYWADQLGVLIMADVPNSWGPPDAAMFREHDYAMREMIERDYNHPSIFAWIPFNEAWGLTTKTGNTETYLPATQRRVAATVKLARSLDPTRLVEDNSPCCGRGHVETDLNSWHSYLSGWQWNDHLKTISDSTFPGSPWNFEKGHRQARQPNINSEFGNVWGYEGSTGDVDWSWDYHLAVNAFRRNPKIAGWLYTEHHDVINEWNGYWRFDRSNKETGFGSLVPGMTLRDLHSPFYIAVGTEMSPTVTPGQRVEVPLWASFLTDAKVPGDSLTLSFQITGRNTLGDSVNYGSSTRRIAYTPWSSQALDPFTFTAPSEPAVLVLSTQLTQGKSVVVQRNFMTFVVEGTPPTDTQLTTGQHARLIRVAPKDYTDARWSQKAWSVLDGLKINGAGSGYFEYRLPWPAGVDTANVAKATFLVEASAKQLFGKDRDSTSTQDGDYMRGKGFHDPSRNPNSYPMTDDVKYPSRVTVRVNGEAAGTYDLSDDPADHRGILSWHAQPRDHHLHEAGSYGQLLRVPVSRDAIAKAAKTREFVVRLEVDPSLPGGLAIYGAHFGRYPLDPTLMLVMR